MSNLKSNTALDSKLFGSLEIAEEGQIVFREPNFRNSIVFRNSKNAVMKGTKNPALS